MKIIYLILFLTALYSSSHAIKTREKLRHSMGMIMSKNPNSMDSRMDTGVDMDPGMSMGSNMAFEENDAESEAPPYSSDSSFTRDDAEDVENTASDSTANAAGAGSNNSPMGSMDMGSMDMGSNSEMSLNPQQAGGDLEAMQASGAMGDEEQLNKNITINGVNLFAIAQLFMGLNHPSLMHVEHCRQVPYFVMPEERTDCIAKTGYFYNMTTRACEPVVVYCNDIPTLNFWETIDGCLANCTVNGTGLVWTKSPKVNLDPRQICIEQAYYDNLSIATCPKGSKKNNTVWTYDPSVNTCYKVKIDCHYLATNNTFAYNSTCQHMCHDITYPGSTKGHHLYLPGQTSNKTYNGVSLVVNQEKFVGFSRNVTTGWELKLCKVIPFYDTPRKAKKKCTPTPGYFYNATTRKCETTAMPCNGWPSANFWSTVDNCTASCTVNGTGIKFAAPRINIDPRDICNQPVYHTDSPFMENCTANTTIVNVWTYDSKRGVCGLVSVDCHTNLTDNAFNSSQKCINLCARIAPLNAGFGIFYFNDDYGKTPQNDSSTPDTSMATHDALMNTPNPSTVTPDPSMTTDPSLMSSMQMPGNSSQSVVNQLIAPMTDNNGLLAGQ